MQPLTFDGFDVTHFAFVRLERPPGPATRLETQDVPGRDGSVVLGITRDKLEVVAHCTLKRRHVHLWDTLRRNLAVTFSQAGERRLTLPDEDGLWRMATACLTTGVTTPLTPPVDFDITFTCHDPAAYGEEKTVAVPSGGSATFSVGGTMPPTVEIYAPAATRDPTTHLWGLRFDNADFIHVPVPTANASAVRVDCAARKVSVAGATSMATLDSDWPTLAADATHAVSMDQGTGAATVTITERWL